MRDADRSRNWYTTVLGLRVEFELPSPRAVALQDSGGFGLFLEQPADGDFQPSCVLTFRVEDVDALARTLRAAGVTLSAQPQKLFWATALNFEIRMAIRTFWDEQSMKAKGG